MKKYPTISKEIRSEQVYFFDKLKPRDFLRAKGKYERPGIPLIFKIKNQVWLDKVKDRYQDRYEELA